MIWSKAKLGCVKRQKLHIFEVLNKLDVLLESRLLSSYESSPKVSSLNELDGILCLEEIMRRQMTRSLWLKQGDQNSKNFHHVANTRYYYNLITHFTFKRRLSLLMYITHAFTTYFSQIFSAAHHPLLHAN